MERTAGREAMAAGHPVTVPVPPTIADGQQTAQIGRRNCAIIDGGVDEIVGVTDDEILVAVRLLFERLKVVVEPSGASRWPPSWPVASTWPVSASASRSRAATSTSRSSSRSMGAAACPDRV